MKKIKLSEPIKNVTKISTGSAAGQIISIVTLPFITRLYGAEIIGIWAVITSFSNIVQNFCDLGLANSVMMCDEDEIRLRYSIVTKLSILFSTISGVVIALYLMLTQAGIEYSITVGVFTILFAFGLRQILTCYTILNRDKEYNILMKNSVLRFSSIAVISIAFGLIGKYLNFPIFIQYGYFVGNIVGQTVTIIHMKRFLPKVILRTRFSEYKRIITENIDYVRYQMPSSITVILRTDLPNLLISALFGNTILGYYSISQKLLTIPVTFLGQSLGTVFYQRAAEMARKGQQIGDFVQRNIKRGMLIALVPMTLFAAFGDIAINIFFGKEYSVGGVICRIIVYRTLFNFISTSTRGLDIVLNKQQYVLYTGVAQTILAVGSVLCGFYCFNSIYITSLLLVVTFIVVQIFYFVTMYRFMNLNWVKYIRDMALTIAAMFAISTAIRYLVILILQSFPNGFFNYLLSMFSTTSALF